eukprot:5536_1
MSQSLSSHLHSKLTTGRHDRNPPRTKGFNVPKQRYLLFIVLIFLVLSSFFFDIGLQMYWSAQPTLSAQAIQQRLDLSLSASHTNTLYSNTHNTKPQHNLLTNQTQFDELLSYYSKISEITYPSSWIHLNEQLFCPIRHSHAITTDTISNAGERLLKYIYNTQFVSDCHDTNHKYIIFDITQMKGTGIGATFNGAILKWFIRAMMSDRIFLINGAFGWAQDVAHCTSFIGMECYFLPPSNCNPNDILSKAQHKDVWKGSLPTHCTLGDDDILHWCSERIIYSTAKASGWAPPNADINQWIHSHVAHNISLFSNFVEFKAVLQSFIFRMKPNVRGIVMKKVRNAFIKSLSITKERMHNFDPFKSISFPIRASDKCYKNALDLNGEMQCWTKEEVFLILQSVHVLSGHIDTVIFTSEDFDYVDKLMDCMEHQTHCENTSAMNIFDNYLDFEWHIITNDEDTKPSIGNAKFKLYQAKHKQKFKFVDDIGVDWEHDVVVGAFSSFMLQMQSKYVVHTKSSSWLDNVWNMASSLFCESILWSEQLKLNGFTVRDDDVKSDIKQAFDRLEREYQRPYFLPQYNYKYHGLNRQCFELKQYGTLNKKTKHKHVLYPVDLFDKIHALKLDPELFYSVFGIQIFENGWNNYCMRYTKLPFDTDVDVGV